MSATSRYIIPARRLLHPRHVRLDDAKEGYAECIHGLMTLLGR